MCEANICACQPVRSGKDGPLVHVLIDRRSRPNTPTVGGKRAYDLPLRSSADPRLYRGHQKRARTMPPRDLNARTLGREFEVA